MNSEERGEERDMVGLSSAGDLELVVRKCTSNRYHERESCVPYWPTESAEDRHAFANVAYLRSVCVLLSGSACLSND